jgi:hypothetical protein
MSVTSPWKRQNDGKWQASLWPTRRSARQLSSRLRYCATKTGIPFPLCPFSLGPPLTGTDHRLRMHRTRRDPGATGAMRLIVSLGFRGHEGDAPDSSCYVLYNHPARAGRTGRADGRSDREYAQRPLLPLLPPLPPRQPGLLASVHRFVASSTANTAARSPLSLISADPLRSSV